MSTKRIQRVDGNPQYLGVIADMVGSRSIDHESRESVQRRFNELVDSLNTLFAKDLASKFIITLGDEFQGVLRTPAPVADILWHLEECFVDRQLRVGIGYGALTTSIPEYAINLDGPALHLARLSLVRAKKQKRLGGIFTGFGAREDDILNGVAGLLRFHRARLTRNQKELLGLVRQGYSQTRIADTRRETPQSINSALLRAGWQSYLNGERALQATLAPYLPDTESL